MLALHLPKQLEQISSSLKRTEPGVWIVLAIAAASLVAILVVTFVYK
jgi:hypothetical protein